MGLLILQNAKTVFIDHKALNLQTRCHQLACLPGEKGDKCGWFREPISLMLLLKCPNGLGRDYIGREAGPR